MSNLQKNQCPIKANCKGERQYSFVVLMHIAIQHFNHFVISFLNSIIHNGLHFDFLLVYLAAKSP